MKTVMKIHMKKERIIVGPEKVWRISKNKLVNYVSRIFLISFLIFLHLIILPKNVVHRGYS